MSRFWKIFFFIFLAVFLLALSLQIYEYVGTDTIKVIALDTPWGEVKHHLIKYTLGLLALNFAAYKMQVFGTGENQVVNGMLACSVLALLYFTLSRIAIPYVLLCTG